MEIFDWLGNQLWSLGGVQTRFSPAP